MRIWMLYVAIILMGILVGVSGSCGRECLRAHTDTVHHPAGTDFIYMPTGDSFILIPSDYAAYDTYVTKCDVYKEN